MAYQFVRIETYCPKPMPVPHSDDQFNSIEQVFLEAERDARYSKHVPDPEPPAPIIGFGSMSVSKLRSLHDARRAEIRETVSKPDGTTYQRSLKSDFPTLYTEIHSHPMTAADYKAASQEEKARVHRWAKLALSDFSKRILKGVKFAAVLHLDEGHVHFNILAVNIADPKMNANKLHVGKIAAEEWRHRNGQAETLNGLPKPELQARPNKPKNQSLVKTPTTQRKRDATYAATVMVWETDCKRIEAANADAIERWRVQNNIHLRKLRKDRKGKTGDVEAYEAALVGFQDRYYETVGRRCGLLRNGPGTERLPAQQYHARKEQARAMADHDAAMRAQAARHGAERAQITVDAIGIVEEKAALAHLHAEVDAAVSALAEREREIAQRDAALGAAEDSMRKKEQVQEEAERTLSQRAVAMEERERALEEKQQDLTMKVQAFHRDAAARQADMDTRERIVTEQQAEVAQAASAVEDLVDQLDAGILIVEDGKLRFGRIHAFVGRAIDAPADQRSPMQRVAAKFAGFLMRAASALSGSATPIVEHEDRPGL